MDVKSMDGNSTISWLGSTNLAVGSIQNGGNFLNEVDCVLNCDTEAVSMCLPEADAYLHLPIVRVCCRTGEDISICICLAILTSLFDDKGIYIESQYFSIFRIICKL
ncbi:hypothetical protein IFM89_039884 [Coptis chinensis]|uniref:Rit1 DUSP-like domain-containing protein n=1 Tax=Coptis chinensis TaxID=261450 RepID=A0A835GVI3_9MAGN|nr:hypothetical protein IFM89_039884 [Coptis chinensis]